MIRPGFLSALRQDLRFAARMIAKRPGFSAAIVLTVALGIGANTALFSVIRAVLLRPLGYTDPQQFVVLTAAPRRFTWTSSAPQPAPTPKLASTPRRGADGPDHRHRRARGRQRRSASPATSSASSASRPSLGRSFLPAEDRTGGPDVAIISTRLWQQHFGGNPAILGHTATLAGTPYTIVGVLPPRFAFPFGGRHTGCMDHAADRVVARCR